MLASIIGCVGRGALDSGLFKVTYGFQGESLLPLLCECEGVSVEEWRVSVAERRGVRVWQAFSGSCRVGRVGWASVPGLRAPRFFLCAPAVCGCVLVARRGVAIFVGEGRLVWVLFSCFCSRIRVRACACLFVLCGV